MHCKKYSIHKAELSFKVPEHLKDIMNQKFLHHKLAYSWDENVLHTSESASNDLVDFLRETNLSSGVTFRAPHQEWLPLEAYDKYRETSWLDTLIKASNIKMYFQPIITQTGLIYGYELLARFLIRTMRSSILIKYSQLQKSEVGPLYWTVYADCGPFRRSRASMTPKKASSTLYPQLYISPSIV